MDCFARRRARPCEMISNFAYKITQIKLTAFAVASECRLTCSSWCRLRRGQHRRIQLEMVEPQQGASVVVRDSGYQAQSLLDPEHANQHDRCHSHSKAHSICGSITRLPNQNETVYGISPLRPLPLLINNAFQARIVKLF